jgi:uncharacterized membrane protein
MNEVLNTPSEKAPINLERATRIVLIIAIIIVSSSIVYNLVRPKEEFVQFSILNDQLIMGNYPTHVKVGESVGFYIQVENYYRTAQDFQISLYRGNSTSSMEPVEGVKNATHLQDYTENVVAEGKWLTPLLNVTFSEVGPEQFVAVELWQKIEGEWHYLPNYIVFLRLNVTAT